MNTQQEPNKQKNSPSKTAPRLDEHSPGPEAGERTAARELLGEAELAELFDQANVGVAVLDEAKNLVALNEAFASLLGVERHELVGTPLSKLVPARFFEEIEVAAQTGTARLHGVLPRPQGGSLQADLYQLPQARSQDGETRYLLRLEKPPDEDVRNSDHSRLRSQQKIERTILTTNSVQETAQVALEEIRDILHCRGAAILSYDETADTMRVLVASGIDAEEGRDLRLTKDAKGRLLTGETLVTDDIAAEPDLIRTFSADGNVPAQAAICVPLVVRTSLIGALILVADDLGAFAENRAAVVRGMAESIGAALYGATLLQRERRQISVLRRNYRVLTMLARVSLQAQVTLNPDKVMETMGTALDKLGIRCSVLLAEEDGGDVFRLRYQSGPEGLLRRISEMLGVPLIGLPVRRSQLGQVKRPALISDPVSAATRALPGIAHSVLHTVTRLLGMTPETPTARLPLLVGEEAIGVLIVWGRELVASDLPALSVFASQVAIALQNARSLKAESAARAQAETLREVAGVLSSSLELDHVLDLILRQLARVVVFDSASIMLIRGDGYYVAARHGRLTGLDAGTSLKRYMLPGIDAIIDERRPVIVSDTEIDPDWVSFTDSQRIRSWLGVPLLVKNEVIGVLNINKDRPSFYTEEDASLATAFAQQAALAIENARLFVQVRRYAYELEQRVIARTQDLATLYDVAAITSKPLDLETVLQRSIQSMFMRLDCHGGAVYLQDEAEESLRLAAALGVPRQLVEHNESPLAETGILEQVMTLGNPAVSTFRGQSVAGLEGEWTCTGVPMRFRGHSFGVLVVYSEGREPFDREELALLGSFADHMAAAVENARLRQQASQLAILKERERLAGELHDSVTQSLYSLRLFSEAAREQLESQHVARASDYMQDISATARRALKEMRLLLYELRSDSYLKDGLLAALYHRLDAVEKRAGVKTAIEMDSLLELPSALEEMLYRVAQEALNNALKHAEANNMTVRVKLEGAQVRMEVEDDGRGFDTSHDMPAGGMGLENMQRRVREFGGTLDIVSAPGAGTRVIVQVPVSRRGLQAAARDVAGEQDEILPIRDWPSP